MATKSTLRRKLLLLVGILCVLIGCGHKNLPPPQSEASLNQSTIPQIIHPPAVQPSGSLASEQEQKLDKTVTVKGYGAIIDDIPKARDEALMDAYSKAIEAGLGVHVYGKTVVKRFQVVEHIVMTERKGYVKSFEILSENPKSDLGYEVTVKAVVSENPISKFDDLKFLIKLMGNPRLMVFVESEDRNRSIVEGHIIAQLQQVGYHLIDKQQMEKLRERDFKEKTLLGDWETAAILGNRLGADIAIVGNVEASVTTKIEGSFPIIVATARGYFKAIVTETAEIIYSISDADIPQENRKGSGNTDAKAIGETIDKFVGEAARKLVWELPEKIGLITVRLLLRDCTYEQAEQFTRLIKPLRIVEDVHSPNYQNSIAEINVETTRKTQSLAAHLQKKLPDVNIEIERFGLGIIEIRILESELRGNELRSTE